MRILALECSTDVGSLALVAANRVVWEYSWGGPGSHRQAWVADLEKRVRGGELPLGEVDLFAVGVGPGAFSGLRMAIALMQGLALPVRAPVFGVSSGAALASRVGRDLGVARVVVAGDARRNEFWLGQFCLIDGHSEQSVLWAVVPGDRVPHDYAAPDAVWVTADWHRIGSRLKAACPSGQRIVEERRIPEAGDVGLLAGAAMAAGRASLPLAPLYLHPAVFVQPRDAAVR